MSLSLGARLLLRLERWFPPAADAPAERGEHAPYEFAKAAGSYGKFVEEIGGLEGKTVLDFGCGWGGESAWLARRTAYVVGCDVNAEALEDAWQYQRSERITNLEFAQCGERTLPFEDAMFDAVFSTNVFEHVTEPAAMLREIRRVLKPGGSFVSTFGPLFYSPLGYHLPWATRVPWAHVLLGLEAVMQVRNTKRAAIAPPPASWRDTGLNMVTFPQFQTAVRESGLGPVRLRRVPVKGQRWLASLPGVGEYFTFGVDCHLVRPAESATADQPLRRAA